MINIVLFGPPGSGKGTQAEKMSKKYDLIHISTGDIFRKAIKNKTELGLLAKSYAEKGNLVPDEVTIGLMNEVINENTDAKGIIFDGYPRSVKQAEALDEILNSKKTPVTKMILLDVSEDELISRLMNRGKDSGRADDQDTNIIKNRISVYNTTTLPVANFYENQDKLAHIKGEGTIEEIFNRVCTILD